VGDSGATGARLRAKIAGARRVVAFTGAGVSAESGLGTFRGSDGLWQRYRAEDLATPEAFLRDPRRVARWYAERFVAMRAAQPNPAHRAIASWQDIFATVVVVTQNIDRLHQRAGSRDVLELHGTLWTWRCSRCESERPSDEIVAAASLPVECSCGGRFRPSVVWFGEPLPFDVFERAATECARCDLLVIVGTSGTVWPAAGLVDLARRRGAAIVEVNRETTAHSTAETVTVCGAAGEELPRLTAEWTRWRSPA